jgi:hypothetical protein
VVSKSVTVGVEFGEDALIVGSEVGSLEEHALMLACYKASSK